MTKADNAVARFEKYVEIWRGYEPTKPENEPECVEAFIEMMNALDDPRDMTFDGEGAYSGVQITVTPYSSYPVFSIAAVEIAYSNENLVVYTAFHNGYWSPTYISLKSDNPDFARVHGAIISYIKRMMKLD